MGLEFLLLLLSDNPAIIFTGITSGITEARQQAGEEGQKEGPLAGQNLQHPQVQDGQARRDDGGTTHEEEAGEEGAEEGDVCRDDEQEEEGEGVEGEVRERGGAVPTHCRDYR